MDSYKISLDRKVLKQLGSQLYGDTPSVIAELVANSHDADAHNVWITLNTTNSSIIVEDDGKGMDVNDINNSFLNIGYDKREKSQKTNLGRNIMGRKGIGKLAVFSLTSNLRVLSIKKGVSCGCELNFNEITDNNKEPNAINGNDISFDPNNISEDQCGTRLELINVKKKIALSYRFIISKLIRIFDVNDSNFKIYIRKNEETYKKLERSILDYFSIMDTIIVIGDEQLDKIDKVKSNTIDNKYKSISTYHEFVQGQKSTKNKLNMLPYDLEVEDSYGNSKIIQFTLNGWIGTVDSLPHLKALAIKFIGDDEDEDIITINDNRISLYARGKLGEYDILTKIKNNRNSEAYVIGELFVDIFEDNELTDMAISNRRGYEENDSRYTEVIRISKRLLGYIVNEKDDVQKRIKYDNAIAADIEESERIKQDFWSNLKTKEILDKKLDEDEKSVVEFENIQFTRAVNSGNSTKKIFISHRTEHKLYGQFIVDVLEEYDVDVERYVIFTSNRKLGVPQGKDIYVYLKQCFRDDLMVIFLFGKAFYDSNICVSEAGAAWATNQNCLNVAIDIGFNDIEKPSNNALSSVKFFNIHTDDQIITLHDFFRTIITTGLSMNIDDERLSNSLKIVLNHSDYSDSNINNPKTFCPYRKFLPHPTCTKCLNVMNLEEKENTLTFKCSNISCNNSYDVVIK